MAVLNIKEEQPNSDKRKEFLIVLDYLLTKAYDAEHATNQQDIIQYAENQYKVFMRRDRIPQILIHLQQLTEKYPNKFPFRLKTVSTKGNKGGDDGTRTRYYIDQRGYDDSEILSIISAIKKDKTISDQKTDELIDKFLNLSATPNKKNLLKNRVYNKKSATGGSVKLPKNAIDQLDKIQYICDNRLRVLFWLKDKNHFDADHYNGELEDKIHSNELLYGYFYRTIAKEKDKYDVAIYFDSYNTAIVTPYDNITIQSAMNIGNNMQEYNLFPGRFTNIDEWLEAHYTGKDGFVRTFVFKITYRDDEGKEYQPEVFKRIKDSFKKHWKQDMQFEVKPRVVDMSYRDENNERVEKHITVQDAYVTIESNVESFRKWYMNYDIFPNVVIVSPGKYNEFWLGELTRRLVRRLTKYGGVWNYELNRTIKPEYEEEMRKRHEEFVARREERRKRLEERENKKEGQSN